MGCDLLVALSLVAVDCDQLRLTKASHRLDQCVEDHLQIFCDGTVEIRLEAPEGIVLGLEISDEDGPIQQATAAAGTPAVIRLGEQSCGGNDARTLRAVVRPIGSDRVAGFYKLTRRGNF